MAHVSLNPNPIHIVGIGGAGMSAIAQILHALGYQVQGSDIVENASVRRLRCAGLEVMIGHHADNLGNAALVAVSSAVCGTNPEIDAARARRIPVLSRAEMLAKVMLHKRTVAVAGTHGKTTTTGLMASLFEAARMDPTVINGGIINAWRSNARFGKGEWMIVEADESDGTFIKLPTTCAVVTNIDPEHIDHYGSFDALRLAFQSFVANIDASGFAAVCVDHSETQNLIASVRTRNIISYGFSPQADVRARNVTSSANGMRFDVEINLNDDAPRTLPGVNLPLLGEHNVANALATIAVGSGMGLSDDALRAGVSSFSGVRRRFTTVGISNGVTIVDDYAHHPREISATLRAARSVARGRVIAVLQPHRYSRLRDLFDEFCACFDQADHVVVADVYAAGEAPIDGYDRNALAQGLCEHGHPSVSQLEHTDDLAAKVRALATAGDLVICLGAGSISSWANSLPRQMNALSISGVLA